MNDRHGQEIVYLLLAYNGTDINAEDNDGLTPYCTAISHGHTEIQNMFEEVAGDKLVKDCPTDYSGIVELFEES